MPEEKENTNNRRCFGLTKTLHRCARRGEWRLFCQEHRRQPLTWSFTLLFTILTSLIAYVQFFQSLYSPSLKPSFGPGGEVTQRATLSGLEQEIKETSCFSDPTPRLFAHRGASGEAPENTMPAFQRAADLGIVYMELDVHLTSDGHVVVLHDETLERTTNGHGQVKDQTLAKLQQFDAGYHFSPDDGKTFPFRGQGVTISPLAEVLRRFPQVRFTVEIKQKEPPVEEQVIAVVQECGVADTVVLASEHDAVVARVRNLAPDIATNCAVGEVFEFMQKVFTNQLDDYRPPGQAFQIPPEYEGVALVTSETVAAIHALGAEVHVWTINDPQEMERLFDLGVDGLMSDFPGRLLDVARKRVTRTEC